jgi:hypothetical protein
MVKKKVINPSKHFLWFISHEKYIYYLFGLFFILFVVYLFFFLQNQNSDKVNFDCVDGTLIDSCSLTKPYYCENGVFVEKASICGCPEGLLKDDDECLSKYHNNSKEITLHYVLNGKKNKFNFIVYKGMEEYLSEIPRSIETGIGEEVLRTDFKNRKINEEIQKSFLLPLVFSIKNITNDKEDQMRIAVSVVQNIPWGYSDKLFRFAGQNLIYSRYPYEILYDNEGICGEKSELLAFLLKELGYEVVLFYNKEENHESVGVRCPLENSWNNSGYCFVETSGPAIISDSSISYVGGVSITSKPLIMSISEGISLGENLEEYEDAKEIMEIRERALENGGVRFFDKFKLYWLNKKYSLIDEYNLE